MNSVCLSQRVPQSTWACGAICWCCWDSGICCSPAGIAVFNFFVSVLAGGTSSSSSESCRPYLEKCATWRRDETGLKLWYTVTKVWQFIPKAGQETSKESITNFKEKKKFADFYTSRNNQKEIRAPNLKYPGASLRSVLQEASSLLARGVL